MKINNNMKILVLTFLLLNLISCDRYPEGCNKSSHRYIVVKNRSNNEFYFTFYANKLQLDYNLTKFPSNTLIKQNSEKKVYQIMNDCWENGLKNNSSIYFYFYDAAVLDKNLWSDVVRNNLGILDSIKVDLDYMQKNNWTVTYPK
jgi:hypothetical protein